MAAIAVRGWRVVGVRRPKNLRQAMPMLLCLSSGGTACARGETGTGMAMGGSCAAKPDSRQVLSVTIEGGSGWI